MGVINHQQHTSAKGGASGGEPGSLFGVQFRGPARRTLRGTRQADANEVLGFEMGLKLRCQGCPGIKPKQQPRFRILV